MARVTLTKSELESKNGREFIKFVEGIGSDDTIDFNEVNSLLSAVDHGGKFHNLVGAGFLRETIQEIINDGKIEQHEIERLRYAISRVLPKSIRDESGFYSEKSITASYQRLPTWHKDPATDKQLDLLLKLGIDFNQGLTKGEASIIISKYIQQKEARPTPRQMMILRFFNKMEFAECGKAEVSDWMDRWYLENAKRKEAWERYKLNQRGEITDPESVEIGIGLVYLGVGYPTSKKDPIVAEKEVSTYPHIRPKPIIEKTTNPKSKKMERALQDPVKFEEQQKAKLEVENHNAVLDSLLSIHHQAADPFDWKKLAYALPPHATEFHSTQYLRKRLASFSSLAWGEQIDVELQEMRQRDERDYLARCSDHLKSTEQWLKLKNLALRVISGDITAYCEAVQALQPFSELSKLATEIRFNAHDTKKVSCSIKITGLEIIPTEIKALTATGKLSVKAMPKSRLHDIYQDFASGCSLRIGREIFALLPVDYVIINIEVTQLDSTSEGLTNMPILSVLLDRHNLEKMNFCQLDLSESLQNFISRGDVRIPKKTGSFIPIVPLTFEELDLESWHEEDLNLLIAKIESAINRYQAKKQSF
jgi:hypothetical protein